MNGKPVGVVVIGYSKETGLLTRVWHHISHTSRSIKDILSDVNIKYIANHITLDELAVNDEDCSKPLWQVEAYTSQNSPEKIYILTHDEPLFPRQKVEAES